MGNHCFQIKFNLTQSSSCLAAWAEMRIFKDNDGVSRTDHTPIPDGSVSSPIPIIWLNHLSGLDRLIGGNPGSLLGYIRLNAEYPKK